MGPGNVENTGFLQCVGVKMSELSKLNVPEMMPRKGMTAVLTAEVPCDGVRTCGRAELQKKRPSVTDRRFWKGKIC